MGRLAVGRFHSGCAKGYFGLGLVFSVDFCKGRGGGKESVIFGVFRCRMLVTTRV